ncbi:MAG: 2-oxoacid:acceptor oxidoreductase family protein [Candidatus Heimdallarchaeota archaeon]|nr:2-oxoacid:acceptor oxidoreductase family protein [Candidatus Heimdallarchaeota archaeon]MCK4954702.1 2-oxoacid:acceptor oxidoreductase family protein [Candidatus Heimdallarchaeota archaeon]
MLEIRFHGRGGTGSVLASQALAKALFYAGKHAITFPSFGAERRGAPVLAFARINNKTIFKRTKIYEPNIIVVLDDDLLQLIDVAQGLKAEGIGVINSTEPPENIKLSKSVKVGVVDATSIAQKILGEPITNSAMLGALIRSIEFIPFSDLEKGILSVFGTKLGKTLAEKNVEAARKAYEEINFGISKGGRSYSKHQPWLPTVDELPIGTIIPKRTLENGQIIGPGSALIRVTGTWNHHKSKIVQEKCNQCLLCLFHCPEGTINREGENLSVNRKYCKACGICKAVCSSDAIMMEKIEDFSEIMS